MMFIREQIHLTNLNQVVILIKLGRPDPVAYADETGPVSYEVAKASVEKVLADYSA